MADPFRHHSRATCASDDLTAAEHRPDPRPRGTPRKNRHPANHHAAARHLHPARDDSLIRQPIGGSSLSISHSRFDLRGAFAGNDLGDGPRISKEHSNA